MHIVSSRELMRDSYTYEEAPGGGWIGYPVRRHREIEPAPSWLARLWRFFRGAR